MADFKPNIRDFAPDNMADLVAFQKYGIVPEGYLSRQDVARICPGCAETMQKAHMPLIREERFVSDINKRVAYDIYNNATAWAKALLAEEDMVDELKKSEYAKDYDLDSADAEEPKRLEETTMRKAYSDIEKVYNELFPKHVYLHIRVPKSFKSSEDHFRHTVARSSIAKCLGLGNDFEYGAELMKAVSDELEVRRRGTVVDKFKAKLRADRAANVYCEVEPVIGTKPTLVDFVKAYPEAAMDSWAGKMRKEGGDKPHSWCTKKAAKFAKDPEGFCAAVHLRAYGKTPAERRAAKRGR